MLRFHEPMNKVQFFVLFIGKMTPEVEVTDQQELVFNTQVGIFSEQDSEKPCA
jgi:hypothetical protein